MPSVNAFLNLNKPVGKSSFALVSMVREATGIRRVGHGGTLDPEASGVLPICLGQATRMTDYLMDSRKRYEATVRLGIATDTYDAEGRVTADRDPSGVTRRQAEAALAPFRGRIRQVPPMYSALKRQGQPLYKLARQGAEIHREARQVEVYSLGLASWTPPYLRLDVECGRGTYIRSLAHDLGEALGCGAHLAALVRTRVGPFSIQDALSVEQLFDAAHAGYLDGCLYPMDCVVLGRPAAILDSEGRRAVQQGKLVRDDEGVDPPPRQPGPGELCRAYDDDGELFALLAYDDARQGWQPTKVFIRDGGGEP